MKTIRKCAFCGKEFVARSGMQKYCSEQCQTKAKEARKKKQRDFINAVEPVIDVQSQEYLTFSKAAILTGCTRQYVYKLVNEGKLAASRISSRMAFIRKADIEQMPAVNPYHRVLPGSSQNKVGQRPSTPSSSLSSKNKAKSGSSMTMPFTWWTTIWRSYRRCSNFSDHLPCTSPVIPGPVLPKLRIYLFQLSVRVWGMTLKQRHRFIWPHWSICGW